MDAVAEGAPIALAVRRGESLRTYYFRVYRGHTYSTFAGVVRGEEIIGRKYGEALELADAEALIFKPTLRELMENFYERPTQVVYPKDLGIISLEAGLKPGMRVVEGGTGSGFLTTEIARIVCPTGRVYTYDVRPENIEAAKRNIKLAGLDECVEFKLGDVKTQVGETNLDAAILDIPDPWEALETLWPALKNGAPLITFIPTMNQIIKLVEKLPKGWIITKTIETLEREVETAKEAIRPARTSPFTGFIVVLRKTMRNP
ncbi:MAG: tRNA (adenine-N1)-methyltransferase [Thermoprotei archaeon]|nr:tRNA (adenine-N1)-methyltransferase [Thermoprotei archaeon]